MKAKLFLLFIVGMFLISFTFALDNQGVGKQNTQFTIEQVCGNANYITLGTIQYPDKTVQVINANMTFVGGGAYQYNFSSTSQLGRYDVKGISDGCEGTFAFYFEIKPNIISTLGFYILLFVLSLGVILIGYYAQDATVVTLGGFGLILVGLFILFYGLDGYKDTAYTWGIGIITLMLGAYFTVRASLEQLN